jgi:hypothetical protein
LRKEAFCAGDKTDPIVVGNGTTLWFRGRRILDAVLDYLKLNYGLGEATEVLLSGGSAGGLSTFLHADYVRSLFGKDVKFGAAPVSGFFLLHDTAQGLNQYPANMEYVYHMMNSSGGVNQRCRAAVEAAAAAEEEAWKCIFANYSYAHTQTPTFPLQSSVRKTPPFWSRFCLQKTTYMPRQARDRYRKCVVVEGKRAFSAGRCVADGSDLRARRRRQQRLHHPRAACQWPNPPTGELHCAAAPRRRSVLAPFNMGAKNG